MTKKMIMNVPYQEVKRKGYKVYNACKHHLLDLSHLDTHEEYQNTVSVLLPNGRNVTLCFAQLTETELNIDIDFHVRNDETQVVKSNSFSKGVASTAHIGNGVRAVYIDNVK